MRMGRQLLSFEQALRWTADFASRRARTLAFDRPVPYLARVVLLAAVYFSAAKLALLAAIPPGYATAVWPPSGIAVASLLLLGTRIWPGIWLGASLVNITVQSSLVAATLMGAGNTLEALAGAALVRAFIGLPGPFRHGEDVVKFVAIAAASATVAATVAAAPLAFVHSLESPELLWNWWTWWQGDTVGIIIVTPLILGWAARARPAWTPRKIAEGSLLVCLLSGVMYAVFGAGMASYIPSLPSLYNRRFLQDYLERELIRARRERAPLALIMMDLDRFKRINDSAGHPAGDQVLVQVGALLKRHVRGSDIACRYGGEEFAVVLPKTTLESARRRSAEICSAIRREAELLRGVTASLGVALCPAHATDAEALLRAADHALYEAKRAGRNRVRIFDASGGAAKTAE